MSLVHFLVWSGAVLFAALVLCGVSWLVGVLFDSDARTMFNVLVGVLGFIAMTAGASIANATRVEALAAEKEHKP